MSHICLLLVTSFFFKLSVIGVFLIAGLIFYFFLFEAKYYPKRHALYFFPSEVGIDSRASHVLDRHSHTKLHDFFSGPKWNIQPLGLVGSGYSRELINWTTLILQVWLNFTVTSVGTVPVPGRQAQGSTDKHSSTWAYASCAQPGNLYYDPEMLRNNQSQFPLSSLASSAIMKIFRKRKINLIFFPGLQSCQSKSVSEHRSLKATLMICDSSDLLQPLPTQF